MKGAKVVYLVILLLLLFLAVQMYYLESQKVISSNENIPDDSSQKHYVTIQIAINQYNPQLSTNEKEQIINAVTQYSQLYDVPITLILSVIAAESKFDPWCQGSLDDTGLMQIRQKYAHYWARKVNITLTDAQQLWNIEVNIKIGTYILKYLKEYYDGDLEKILVAYNAGQTYVNKKVRGNQDLPQKYVRKIDKHHIQLFGEPIAE